MTMLLFSSAVALTAAEPEAQPFDVVATGEPPADVPLTQPWRKVELDPDYGGAWVVAGDIDGDGVAEIVSARNVDQDDVHYTSAVVAQRLDGSVLWRWGDPTIGRRKLHHDVACQIYDWDGDGRQEVVLCTKGALVELDGATGEERRRFALPDDATDCLVFANLSGGSHPTDVLVKTRYGQIWAYRRSGELLWTVRRPGGHATAHQPVPIDVDGDGRDEIVAGYSLLNPDGTVRWTFASEAIDLGRGHADCCRIVRSGPPVEACRLVFTCCGANGIAVVDGNGKAVWEATGHHFESVDVGKVRGDLEGVQLAVDIDHRSWGQGPLWLFDEDGRRLGQVMTDYARHHALVDWNGDGCEEIVIAQARAVFDGRGRRVATFAMEEPWGAGVCEMLALVGDVSGDGVPDVMLTNASASAVYVYRNPSQTGVRIDTVPVGTGRNFTLY